ncbi:exopolysaccharide biosynthesis protein [Geminocystis herdmanii]|uniref:exopolysaccharide biosynthesis protein n=1 Tax=Geminocystis herdmanii TaxID=669359 RepID=UPI00034D4B59|nr:exopolysaccharide biosynthesis protein [Geminocystis herdmanii]
MNLRFSQDLEVLLKRLLDKPLSLSEIVSETSERGFSLVLSILALPFLFPLIPPGVSTILGSGCLFLGLQMALGRTSPWLPSKIAHFQFPRNFTRQILSNFKRISRRLEKMISPRWLSVSENKFFWKINGFCIAWLAFLLMLPIPFTNPLPAGIILLLAIATLEADGLLICIAYVLTIFATLFFAFLGYAIWKTPEILPSIFQ